MMDEIDPTAPHGSPPPLPMGKLSPRIQFSTHTTESTLFRYSFMQGKRKVYDKPTWFRC